MTTSKAVKGDKSGTTFVEKQSAMDEAANKRAAENRESPAEKKRRDSRRDHSEKRGG